MDRGDGLRTRPRCEAAGCGNRDGGKESETSLRPYERGESPSTKSAREAENGKKMGAVDITRPDTGVGVCVTITEPVIMPPFLVAKS